MRKTARKNRDEHGQSLTELAVGLPFVLLVILVLFEMGLVFATYISMINAAREGAFFASRHPELVDPNRWNDALAPGNTTIGEEYESRVRNEVFVVTTQPLSAKQLLTEDVIQVDPPVTDGISDPGYPITVTVHYTLSTFTSNVSLPFFGRFGLPNRYHLTYSFGTPIR